MQLRLILLYNLKNIIYALIYFKTLLDGDSWLIGYLLFDESM